MAVIYRLYNRDDTRDVNAISLLSLELHRLLTGQDEGKDSASPKTTQVATTVARTGKFPLLSAHVSRLT